MGMLTLEGINPSSIDAMVNKYNITISNLLDKCASVAEVTVRQRTQRPWFDDESRMTQKKVRRLERIFRHCRTTELRDAWTSDLHQSRRLSHAKSSAYWRSKISAAAPDAHNTWKSVNTLHGEEKSSATPDFSAQEYLDFIEKKVNDIHEATSWTSAPQFTNCGNFHFNSFKEVSVDDVKIHIKAAPSKQCALDPGPTWLIKKCSDFF